MSLDTTIIMLPSRRRPSPDRIRCSVEAFRSETGIRKRRKHLSLVQQAMAMLGGGK